MLKEEIRLPECTEGRSSGQEDMGRGDRDREARPEHGRGRPGLQVSTAAVGRGSALAKASQQEGDVIGAPRVCY